MIHTSVTRCRCHYVRMRRTLRKFEVPKNGNSMWLCMRAMNVSRVFERKRLLIKNNMPRDIHVSSGMVKTFITFVLIAISHEDTWKRFRVKFICSVVP